MIWPFVSRAKFECAVTSARIMKDFEERTGRLCDQYIGAWAKADDENRELRALLRVAERKLASFERKRGEGGRFTTR